MISNVKGAFKTFEASIYTLDKDFNTAEIDVWIDASSITTGDTKRDENLKSSDFFDTKNHKQITFVSSTIGKADANGNHELWGELTIKGITKNLKATVTFGGIQFDAMGDEKAGFTVTASIKRSEWGLAWNTPMEAGGVLVSDEVKINCDIELINAGQKELTMELEAKATKNK
jgi:polyisoprenoid-binding protein YceI